MAERGARPQVPRITRGIVRATQGLTTPFELDDYLEQFNPLWSTRELRGRIESVDRETATAVTVTIKPGHDWPGHRAGQFVRLGFDIDGVRHWRAYSLTSDPDRADGNISITVKTVEDGVVSPFLAKEAEPGTIVTLSNVEGEFVLPDPPPAKLLFISAGSGVTPIMSMLRHLERDHRLNDVVHLHSAKDEGDVIFGNQLRRLEDAYAGFRLHEQHSSEMGRMRPEDLDDLCANWRDRVTYLSGPADLIDALEEHWEEHGDPELLNIERFQIKLGEAATGEGGLIRFMRSGCETDVDGETPILVAGEKEGLELAYGCREGICHTCVGELSSGKVRDLRTGEVYGSEGEMVRTCISAPEGEIEISL
ncbi:MAG TPA: ferredoxin reductase [Gaiellaceae bacterium]|nr:ferredoxin reductase [Gaiellaceae bacterium]